MHNPRAGAGARLTTGLAKILTPETNTLIPANVADGVMEPIGRGVIRLHIASCRCTRLDRAAEWLRWRSSNPDCVRCCRHSGSCTTTTAPGRRSVFRRRGTRTGRPVWGSRSLQHLLEPTPDVVAAPSSTGTRSLLRPRRWVVDEEPKSAPRHLIYVFDFFV